jgi:hypothetical protein
VASVSPRKACRLTYCRFRTAGVMCQYCNVRPRDLTAIALASMKRTFPGSTAKTGVSRDTEMSIPVWKVCESCLILGSSR